MDCRDEDVFAESTRGCGASGTTLNLFNVSPVPLFFPAPKLAAESRTTCALVPPIPNEFTLTRS